MSKTYNLYTCQSTCFDPACDRVTTVLRVVMLRLEGVKLYKIAYMYQNKMQEMDNMILDSIDVSKNKCIFTITLTSS